ncbi:methyl-accepting chemotaxis protein [uncultured Oceanisphaera sp.]|uniref:methyl-accepting chemotaxis protein n=1 Tax=uncultured Oceanisphaera sp. TaxID=353858 RepID=UPI00263655F0|nr:methyl-accepting chemotaxis protein [uncultured Oceanisphaera sp.]
MMMMLRKWSIKTRLLVLTGLLLLGCLLMALSGLTALQRSVAGLDTVYQDRVVPLQDLKVIADMYAVNIVGSSQKVRSGDQSHAQALNELKEAGRQIDEHWRLYSATQMIPEEARLVDELAPLMKAAEAPLSRLADILRRQDEASLNRFIRQELYQLIDPLSERFNRLMEIQLEQSRQEYNHAHTAFEQTRNGVIGRLLVMLVLGGGLALWLIRSITQPLDTLKAAAAQVAEGDLRHAVECSGNDEIAQVQQSVRDMQLALNSTLREIQGSSTQLAAAAEELHVVTGETTRGINQQNDEVQMAATAVTEMSAAVEEVAGNANRTSSASSETSRVAEEGRQQVTATRGVIDQLADRLDSTSGTVERLATEATNIGQILDVIQAIAEQTNLLALNAAIEAARAGEAGRGFAVVADEVRNLAQRTQSSTAEIERIISTIQRATGESVSEMQQSADYAGRSRAMAGDAEQALNRIAERVGEINDMNLVIASAAEEQAQVAREIDRNLVTISSIAEQSATGVTQTSSASDELAQLAGQMSQLVGRFRLS